MPRSVAEVAGMMACGVAVAVFGCSRPDPLGFTPVTGRVTFDGQPLERGEIRFAPDFAAGNAGPQSGSMLGAGGVYTLRGPGGRAGAVPGRHRVYLAMPLEDGPPTPPIEIDGKMIEREDALRTRGKKLPARYLAPDTSGLTATVTQGEPARFEFELVSTPSKK